MGWGKYRGLYWRRRGKRPQCTVQSKKKKRERLQLKQRLRCVTFHQELELAADRIVYHHTTPPPQNGTSRNPPKPNIEAEVVLSASSDHSLLHYVVYLAVFALSVIFSSLPLEREPHSFFACLAKR